MVLNNLEIITIGILKEYIHLVVLKMYESILISKLFSGHRGSTGNCYIRMSECQTYIIKISQQGY